MRVCVFVAKTASEPSAVFLLFLFFFFFPRQSCDAHSLTLRLIVTNKKKRKQGMIIEPTTEGESVRLLTGLFLI